MSSMKKVSLLEAVKRQYFFKFKAYQDMFGTMIIFQLIGLFFSLQGGTTNTWHNNISVTSNVYDGNAIVFFNFLWVFAMAIYLTNKASKNMMFTFVTDKQTNHLANLFFIITMSVIGGVTAILLGYVVRLAVIVYFGVERILFFDSITIIGLLTSVATVVLFNLLIAMIGYTIGELVQLHKIFIFIVPATILGYFITGISLFGEAEATPITFFFFESSFSLFAIKVIVTTAILFLIATQLGRRLEVRRP